jgi:hypothetical protein
VGEGELLDNAARNYMFLDDALEALRIHAVVPDAFGIHHGDRAIFANAQTIGSGAVHAIEQSEFAQASLEIVPGFDAFFARAAFGFRLVGAQQDMSARGRNLQIRRALEKGGGRLGAGGHRRSCSVWT